MKKLFFLPLLFVSFMLFAQQYGTMYVGAKSGLTFREAATSSSRALDNIPYGTKLVILQADNELKSQVTENMLGYWQKVKHNNKTGYILDSYLLPWAPPKQATVKEMKQYLSQSTTPFGAKLIVKSGSMDNMEEMGWEVQKQLYKNGAEWHKHQGYESGSNTYFLPGFTMEQGFLLLRLIPEFKEVFSQTEVYPTESKTYKKGETEYVLTVDKETYGEGEFKFTWVKRISLEFSPDVSYIFEMFMLGNELVIVFGGGV